MLTSIIIILKSGGCFPDWTKTMLYLINHAKNKLDISEKQVVHNENIIYAVTFYIKSFSGQDLFRKACSAFICLFSIFIQIRNY